MLCIIISRPDHEKEILHRISILRRASSAGLWLRREDAQRGCSLQKHQPAAHTVLVAPLQQHASCWVTVTIMARMRAEPTNSPTAATEAIRNGKTALNQLYVSLDIGKCGHRRVSKQKHTCTNPYGEVGALPACTEELCLVSRAPTSRACTLQLRAIGESFLARLRPTHSFSSTPTVALFSKLPNSQNFWRSRCGLWALTTSENQATYLPNALFSKHTTSTRAAPLSRGGFDARAVFWISHTQIAQRISSLSTKL